MRCLRCLLLLLCITSGSAFSQILPDTIRINDRLVKISLPELGRILASSDTVPALAWNRLLYKGKTIKNASVGFTDSLYWLGFTIQNKTQHALPLILELDNPQIDVLAIYQVQETGPIELLTETGDFFPFAKRLVPYRNFLLPLTLHAKQVVTLLIKIDKRHSSVNFPLYLWHPERFQEKVNTENMGFGIYFGFLLLCFIYSSLTFIFLRKAIYFWYALWIILTGLYLFTSLGFSSQYLWPKLPDFNSIARAWLMMLSFITIFQFTIYFLNIPRHFPVIYRWLRAEQYLVAVFLFIIPFVPSIKNFATPFLALYYGMVTLAIILVLYAAGKTFTIQKRTVLFFLSAFGAIIIASMILILMELGLIDPDKIVLHPYVAGSALEILLFSVGLTFQVKEVYEERNYLSLRIAKHQKETVRAYLDGIEKERNRIAGELHDDIGSRLANLRRVASREGSNHQKYVEEQLEKVSDDIRSLAHQLAWSGGSHDTLAHRITGFVNQLQQGNTTQFSLQFFDLPDQLPDDVEQNVFRMIQEALNNITKHSKAHSADVQIFLHDNELVVTIEDDGVGFDPTTASKSLGLHQLRSRAKVLNGKFELSSSPGEGTQILVTIPIIPSSPSIEG